MQLRKLCAKIVNFCRPEERRGLPNRATCEARGNYPTECITLNI